jgi:lactate permease
LPAIVSGVAFAIAQFIAANYISVPLTDIIAALVSAAAVVALLRVWTPSESPDLARHERASVGGGGSAGVTAGEELGGRPGEQDSRDDGAPATGAGDRTPVRDTGGEVFKAYAPYLIIIVIFSVFSLAPVKAFFAEQPWTYVFGWPGLDVFGPGSDTELSSTNYSLNWFASAGTLMIFAGIITMLVLKISPARGLKTYGRTYNELKWAIVTVMAVLALAYVMNQSGQTTTLGAYLAQTGAFFTFLSPILGWIGVAVTGSDTSANALFGALQVQTAARAGLDPVLLAAANTSGGVLGKMVSPQNLAIAAAAVGMAGKEGEIFRKVFGWSLLLLLFMCILVVLQSTSVLGWMIP